NVGQCSTWNVDADRRSESAAQDGRFPRIPRRSTWNTPRIRALAADSTPRLPQLEQRATNPTRVDPAAQEPKREGVVHPLVLHSPGSTQAPFRPEPPAKAHHPNPIAEGPEP